ncbi:T6SS phospholipase effector Tle1-like catalytic domain-containing protein [Aquicoccus porphyridii]|uniref:T6SS phospholipase effector Tle1-like catalytic domain-containing protein n=1 Tax=Aquicoccus porphyridii TaxID=1852029 RepID=UPI00273FFAC5|nr:DUF2235 domain-containing protein [Aquicoccus porphyridii]
MVGRDFFVFIDGTGCDREHRSNVLRLCEAFESHEENNPDLHVLYVRGVDQYVAMPLIEGAMALGLKRQLVDVCDRLVDKKIDRSDRIHIVGYSRGAVAAMILAQALSNGSARSKLIKDQNLKHPLSAKVEFLGLFDPVVGYVHKFRRFFENLEYKPSIEPEISSYAEILALDERRPLFPARSAIRTFESFMRKRDKYPEARPLQVAPRSKAAVSEDEIDFLRQHAKLSRLPRYFVLMPGAHGEVGGQGGDELLKNSSISRMMTFLAAHSPKAAQLGLAQTFPRPNGLDHSEVQVGRGTSRLGKLGNFRRRRFPKNDNYLVDDLADGLTGRTGVNGHIFFSRFRKYTLPKTVASSKRLK